MCGFPTKRCFSETKKLHNLNRYIWKKQQHPPRHRSSLFLTGKRLNISAQLLKPTAKAPENLLFLIIDFQELC